MYKLHKACNEVLCTYGCAVDLSRVVSPVEGGNQEIWMRESGQGTAGSIEERHGDIGVMEEGMEQTSSVGIVLECDSRL